MHTTPGYADVERAIRSVPGVAEASVVEAPETGRGRLRIRLHPGEDAERVSWSVAATLRERFGIALDPDEIRPRMSADGAETSPGAGRGDGRMTGAVGSPAEANGHHSEANGHREEGQHTADVLVEEVTPSSATASPEPDGVPASHVSDDDSASHVSDDAPTLDGPHDALPSRAVIRDLRSRTDDDGVSVTATLDVAGRLAQGRSVGVPTSRGLLRTIAEATVSALGELTGRGLQAQVDRVSLGGADPTTVTVVVTLLSSRGEELLLGASIVRDDVEHAVMRATLDALNRRVERHLAP